MIRRQTSLSGNIVQFCRFLRGKGFAISVEEEATALESLQHIDYSNNQIFRLALKAVLCKSRSQVEEFDALYVSYWKEIGKALDSKVKTQVRPVMKPGADEASFKALKSWLNGRQHTETEDTAAYSTHQHVSHHDFSSVPSDELDEMMKVIRALARRLAAQTHRRYEKSEKVNTPDLRRTLRKNMRHGGELMDIAYRKPKCNRMKLVVLCDVSKSMDLFAAFLLQFMYAFQQVYRGIETFAFSTALHRITSLFRYQDFTTALQALSAQENSWSSGTKIGESLHTFVQQHAAGTLDKRTVVIILSDGWDTGDIGLLSQSMEYIHRMSKKVIWLNPLAGNPAYKPEVAGMQAALPFVDIFAPVHNTDSLRKLSQWL